MSLKALLFWAVTCLPGHAGEVVVAVAANFLETAEALAGDFGERTGHEVKLAHGSTGRLYAQIVHGAPFDIFLSADRDRPARLSEAGTAADTGSYAVGRLVVLSRRPGARLPEDLMGARIAIANADVAPYGAAAEEVLARWGIGAGEATILRGDSVGQAASLFATGNADFAVVSAAQSGGTGARAVFPVPATAHAPIVQDAALLRRGAEAPAARSFFSYLFSDPARRIIAAGGYDLPAGDATPGPAAVGQ